MLASEGTCADIAVISFLRLFLSEYSCRSML